MELTIILRSVLVLGGVCLVFGTLILYSASGASAERTTAHIVNIAIALTVMWIAANIPLHYLARIALPLYLFGLILLIIVEVIGVEAKA